MGSAGAAWGLGCGGDIAWGRSGNKSKSEEREPGAGSGSYESEDAVERDGTATEAGTHSGEAPQKFREARPRPQEPRAQDPRPGVSQEASSSSGQQAKVGL